MPHPQQHVLTLKFYFFYLSLCDRCKIETHSCFDLHFLMTKDFKIFLSASQPLEFPLLRIIKPALYQDSNKQVDQWNRKKRPEINPHNYGHLHFDKSVKPKQWKKENILQQMMLV